MHYYTLNFSMQAFEGPNLKEVTLTL